MTNKVIDSTSLCCDKSHRTRKSDPVGEVIHRFGVPGVHDAAGVARFDRTLSVLGNKMAYDFVVSSDGTIEQALPLGRHGWHCKGASRNRFGIAALGDFRRQEPSQAQWDALVWLIAGLSYWRGSVDVVGHDEVPGGSLWINHRCPGHLFDMDRFRAEVTASYNAEWPAGHHRLNLQG